MRRMPRLGLPSPVTRGPCWIVSFAVDPIFVGDPGLLRFLRGGAGCSSAEPSWRLLLRDDKYAYLFATVPPNGGRPDTLVLPESDKLTLIME